jgi:hypothetical protein
MLNVLKTVMTDDQTINAFRENKFDLTKHNIAPAHDSHWPTGLRYYPTKVISTQEFCTVCAGVCANQGHGIILK